MEDPDRSGRQRFWRRTAAGAGWSLVLLIAVSIPVAGWLVYEASDGFTGSLGPPIGYSLLMVGVVDLYAAPVVLLAGAVCGAAWAWIVDG